MAIQIPPLSAPPGYRTQAEDTSSEVDLLDFYLLSQRPPTERIAMAASLMQGARRLSLHCLSRQFAHLSPQAFARKLAETWLQEDCPPHYVPTGSEMTWIQDSTELAAQLHSIFIAVGIPYYVTGGVAAITYGEPRTTRDLDVVIAAPHDALNPLVSALEAAGFYVPGVADATTGRTRTLQITQIKSISRADLMLADDDDYERLKFQRCCPIPWPDGTEVYLVSPEDIVINKLRWGQRSKSEKQWRDVLGVLKTQQGNVDYEYMHRWSANFDLSEVLEQATLEAGVRTIAGQQWATTTYSAFSRAFAIAQERSRTIYPSPGLEVADGRRYVLSRDDVAKTFAVLAKLDDREIARCDLQGTVLSASPSLGDRQAWRDIAQKLACQ